MTTAGPELRSVGVYLGSRTGSDPRFAAVAVELGRRLGERRLELVYGGGRVGLMGALADAALDAGGSVHGVIPADLVAREMAHERLTSLSVVDSMPTRKQEMLQRADALVAVPGGLGTLEELFETLSWRNLGLHPKPVGLLDVGGYWGDLLAFLRRSVDEGFTEPAMLEALLIEQQPAALLDGLAAAMG